MKVDSFYTNSEGSSLKGGIQGGVAYSDKQVLSICTIYTLSRSYDIFVTNKSSSTILILQKHTAKEDSNLNIGIGDKISDITRQRRQTCQGNSPTSAWIPPTILLFRLFLFKTPQSKMKCRIKENLQNYVFLSNPSLIQLSLSPKSPQLKVKIRLKLFIIILKPLPHPIITTTKVNLLSGKIFMVTSMTFNDLLWPSKAWPFQIQV